MVLVNISASLIITSIIKSALVLTSLINKSMKAQERERDVFKVTELRVNSRLPRIIDEIIALKKPAWEAGFSPF